VPISNPSVLTIEFKKSANKIPLIKASKTSPPASVPPIAAKAWPFRGAT
jgi:hypothetical protein